jgi:hypothetical protein
VHQGARDHSNLKLIGTNVIRRCFIVTINTRDWSIGLFNWSIPYLIDQFHVLRLLLFNWLISIGFIIRFKGVSSPLTACAPYACAPHAWRPALDQPLEFLLFYSIYIIPLHSSTIIVSINRNCLFDYL